MVEGEVGMINSKEDEERWHPLVEDVCLIKRSFSSSIFQHPFRERNACSSWIANARYVIIMDLQIPCRDASVSVDVSLLMHDCMRDSNVMTTTQQVYF